METVSNVINFLSDIKNGERRRRIRWSVLPTEVVSVRCWFRDDFPTRVGFNLLLISLVLVKINNWIISHWLIVKNSKIPPEIHVNWTIINHREILFTKPNLTFPFSCFLPERAALPATESSTPRITPPSRSTSSMSTPRRAVCWRPRRCTPSAVRSAGWESRTIASCVSPRRTTCWPSKSDRGPAVCEIS